jgi:hypothetical protein
MLISSRCEAAARHVGYGFMDVVLSFQLNLRFTQRMVSFLQDSVTPAPVTTTAHRPLSALVLAGAAHSPLSRPEDDEVTRCRTCWLLSAEAVRG